MQSFSDMQVDLIEAPSRGFEIGVAAARTCYSSKGIIRAEQVSHSDKMISLRDRIAESTLEAGHLTTRQHAHYVFALKGISRQLLWSALHNHPFSNSEQVSQRYVRVHLSQVICPPLPDEAKSFYEETVNNQFQHYEQVATLLRPLLSEEFFSRFPARKKKPELWVSAIEKRCLEVARYVLPLGTATYLYHTVSALTLLRYAQYSMTHHASPEWKTLVEKMCLAVVKRDPLFQRDLNLVKKMSPAEAFASPSASQFSESQAESQLHRVPDHENERNHFDQTLGKATSRLIQSNRQPLEIVNNALQAPGFALGSCSWNEVLPHLRQILSDPLGSYLHAPEAQILRHLHFTFQKKLSHTADSQDQRHRMIFSSRPVALVLSPEPDFVAPFAITAVPEAHHLFRQSMEQSFEAAWQLHRKWGISKSEAAYLLPNARSIRLYSSGDFLSWHHKWKLRSCYNAQEEIFRASVEEMTQVGEQFPLLQPLLGAPCFLRHASGIRPYCPEGDRFCGVPVWKRSLSQYQRQAL